MCNFLSGGDDDDDGAGGAPSVTQRQDMRTWCRTICRPPIRDITLDKQKIYFFLFLAVISSR